MNLKILHEVCSLPTAPFLEHHVVNYARAFARQRGIKISADDTGNLLLELPGKKRLPRWVFTAHMDHPGFCARKMLDARTLTADFRGYVFASFLKGQKVRFFSLEGEVIGTVLEATPEKKSPKAASAILRVNGRVEPNSIGMFDQGVSRVKGKLFYSRAIDDLGGLAATLEMMDQLSKSRSSRPVAPIAVLLTRAEEHGFIGAIAASLKPELLRKSDRIIAIETSAMQTYARQGDGCIVRLGDKTSIFNSAISYFLTQQAQKLAEEDRSFKYQRAIMPGGTCEATVYDVYGFMAGSICVPLGNYHNMNPSRKTIGPEYIDVSDWQNMVKLFLGVARHGHEFEEGHPVLKAQLEKRYGGLKKLL